jgi:hypothetical protein
MPSAASLSSKNSLYRLEMRRVPFDDPVPRNSELIGVILSDSEICTGSNLAQFKIKTLC